MKVSCVIAADDLDQGVRAVHAEFFGNAAEGRTRKASTPTAGRKATAAKTKVTRVTKTVHGSTRKPARPR
jgi:hypothetical protein